MFNFLQHLFTARALQSENSALKAQNEKLTTEINVLRQEVQSLTNRIKHFESPEQEPALTETHEKVIRLLFNKPQSIQHICASLNISKEQTNCYLHDLREWNMVSAPAPYSAGPEQWHINQEGRRYVMQKLSP